MSEQFPSFIDLSSSWTLVMISPMVNQYCQLVRKALEQCGLLDQCSQDKVHQYFDFSESEYLFCDILLDKGHQDLSTLVHSLAHKLQLPKLFFIAFTNVSVSLLKIGLLFSLTISSVTLNPIIGGPIFSIFSYQKRYENIRLGFI
jgi:hypothetical protein